MKQKDGNREIKRNKHGKEGVWIVKEAKRQKREYIDIQIM